MMLLKSKSIRPQDNSQDGSIDAVILFTSNPPSHHSINDKTASTVIQLDEDLRSKEDIIRLLLSHPKVFDTPIKLPIPEVSVAQSHKDFRRERVLFNDNPFIPDRVDVQRSHGFALTLKLYTERLVKSCHTCIDNMLEYSQISDIILQRGCRTSAGIDSFFTVQKLFAVDGTFVTHRIGDDPPIRVDVFISHNTISTSSNSSSSSGSNSDHSINNSNNGGSRSENNGNTNSNDSAYELIGRTEVRNSYAIYDISAMDILTGDDSDPPPWLDIETTVIDESNFKTGAHSRVLCLDVLNISKDYHTICSKSSNRNTIRVNKRSDSIILSSLGLQ